MIKVYTGNFLQFTFLKSKERTKNNEFSDHMQWYDRWQYNDMKKSIEKVNLKEGKFKKKWILKKN